MHTLLAQLAEGGGAARPGPDLAGLAVFTLDSAGRVSAWSVTAQRLLGRTAASCLGQPVAGVLPVGRDGREGLARALAEAAAGRTWSGILSPDPDPDPDPGAGAGGPPGAGTSPDGVFPLAVHCEPLAGPGSGTLVIARPAPAGPGPDLIGEAATRIGSTLDLARTAREFTEVAVPAFADAAAIFVSERLLAAEEPSAEGPGPAAVVRRLAAQMAGQPAGVTGKLLRHGEVLVFGPGSPSYQAMTTLTPVITSRLDADTEQRLARRPGAREALARYASFLAVPLSARGLVLGCLTFARADGPGFGPTDLALAGELAARTAVCVDNARLYHRERRTAFALQQGLAPAEPRIPAAIEVASRYLPVGASVVGGDWHDIVALPGGQAALVVGDAMGHGPEAAAVMVQLRTAAHTLAEVGLPPGELLARLDRMAAGMPGMPYATCICALIDPPARACRIAKAGHPPPVLALPGGKTEVPALPDGLPLGLASGPFGVTEFQLPPGTVLALYTDGLAESRSRPLEDGLAALRQVLSAALAQPGATLDQCCETVTQALRQRGEDDITLLLARIR